MKGAGGTEGGIARFLIGLVMIIGGGFLFLNSIQVTDQFSWGRGFSLWGMNFTTGMVLIPFIFGMGMIFFNSKNYIGWLLVAASLIMLTFGVISSVHFRMRRMSAFDLIMIIGLLTGGIGLFANSLKTLKKSGVSFTEEKEDTDQKED